jgi:predicted transcriptional regulator
MEFSLIPVALHPSAKLDSSSSAARSLAVLAVLSHTGEPMSLADLVHALGLPKATVHRICSQLMESGFLARDVNEFNAKYNQTVFDELEKLGFDTLLNTPIPTFQAGCPEYSETDLSYCNGEFGASA